MPPAAYSSCRPLLLGYFYVILTKKFFSFEEKFFEDQIPNPGICSVPQNLSSRATTLTSCLKNNDEKQIFVFTSCPDLLVIAKAKGGNKYLTLLSLLNLFTQSSLFCSWFFFLLCFRFRNLKALVFLNVWPNFKWKRCWKAKCHLIENCAK